MECGKQTKQCICGIAQTLSVYVALLLILLFISNPSVLKLFTLFLSKNVEKIFWAFVFIVEIGQS